MKRRWIQALILCSMVSSWLLVPAQTPNQLSQSPMVTKAVAPSTYPAIARAAHAAGNVIIEVKINPKGGVVSAKAIQGHALLTSVAVTAARLWQFAALTEGSAERSVKLTFNFQVAAKTEEAQIAFNPPYEITYAVAPPQLDY